MLATKSDLQVAAMVVAVSMPELPIDSKQIDLKIIIHDITTQCIDMHEEWIKMKNNYNLFIL